MTGSFIDDQLWATVIGPDQFNFESGIYQYWRELRRSGQYLGAPVTPEIETPAGIQQAFSSGCVICWSPETGAELASD